MECGCLVDPYDGDCESWGDADPVEFEGVTLTQVRCSECSRIIEPGEKMEHCYAARFIPGWFKTGNTTCTDCLSAIHELSCSRLYGNFWENFDEALGEFDIDLFSFASLAPLTPRARAMACECIEEHFERQNDEEEN